MRVPLLGSCQGAIRGGCRRDAAGRDSGPSPQTDVLKPNWNVLRRAFLGAAAVLLGLKVSASHAQSVPDVEGIKTEIDQPVVGNQDPFAKTTASRFGITAGDWIILPDVTIGTDYNDNVYSSKTNQKSAWGFDVQPEIVFKRFTGIQNTTISVFGDLSPVFGVQGADTYSGGADLRHSWEIERGLTITLAGAAAHEYDQASAFSSTGTGSGINAIYVEPIAYNTYSASADVAKNFSQAFISGGVNLLAFDYDNAVTTTGQILPQSYRDLVEYAEHVRGGIRFLPDDYAFVEQAVTEYDYTKGVPATGYTVTGGVGTDRLSLFRGELFVGYQLLDYGSGASGNKNESGATFGAHVDWTPQRDLVATLTASQAFTPSTIYSGSTGYFVRADTVSAGLKYQFTDRIDLDATATYSNADYAGSSRDDNISQIYMAGTYYFTNKVGLRLEYTFTNVSSNQSIYDYTRNRIVLGLHMRL
jgi:hypothetical protein